MTTAPRSLTIREARHAHAATRARQYYGVLLHRVDVALVEGQILRGVAARLWSLPGRAALYAVTWGKRQLFAVWAEDDECIKTFLAPAVVEGMRRGKR